MLRSDQRIDPHRDEEPEKRVLVLVRTQRRTGGAPGHREHRNRGFGTVRQAYRNARSTAVPGGGEFAIPDVLGPVMWPVWLTLGFWCPPQLLLSWWLIEKHTGKWRYRGLWLRLGADTGQLLALVAFLYSRLRTNTAVVGGMTDAQIYAWIALSGCAFFILCCCGRDIHTLVVTEQVAKQARDLDVAEH